MRAFQLVESGNPGHFELRDLPPLIPDPESVVVEVQSCGLNRLDLWLEEGGLPIPITLPRTPGCEIAGTILALGDDVDEWQIGARVAVQSNIFCGVCEFCQQGQESLCLNAKILGVQQDGGFAQQVLVPWQALVKLPEAVNFDTSAALSLAGSTAMHMLTDRCQVEPGMWVLVVAGASGVGSAAIQIACEQGARVISTGSTPEKRALAQKLGAEFVLDSSTSTWYSEVRKITQKHGVDIVIEHVGGNVLERVFECLARNGVIVTCGATSGRDIRMNLWPFFVKQHKLIGSYGRNRADLSATLEWAAQGRLKPVIHQALPLKQVPEAFLQLRQRQVLGKLIIHPQE